MIIHNNIDFISVQYPNGANEAVFTIIIYVYRLRQLIYLAHTVLGRGGQARISLCILLQVNQSMVLFCCLFFSLQDTYLTSFRQLYLIVFLSMISYEFLQQTVGYTLGNLTEKLWTQHALKP